VLRTASAVESQVAGSGRPVGDAGMEKMAADAEELAVLRRSLAARELELQEIRGELADAMRDSTTRVRTLQDELQRQVQFAADEMAAVRARATELEARRGKLPNSSDEV
jgi:chromosome segregation ATPase